MSNLKLLKRKIIKIKFLLSYQYEFLSSTIGYPHDLIYFEYYASTFLE